MTCTCGDPDCWRLMDEDPIAPVIRGRRVSDDAVFELVKRGERRRIVDVYLPGG